MVLLPYKYLTNKLKSNNCFNHYIKYERHICKVENNVLRIKFLENCKKADLIPKFLKFRIPNNGCFDDETVHQFQKKLLHSEIINAKRSLDMLTEKSIEIRKNVIKFIPENCVSSVMLHSRLIKRTCSKKVRANHNEKLLSLSEQQEKPLFNVKNTVKVLVENLSPPSYVLETLSLGPKNAILDKFNPNEVLAEIDLFLNDCKRKSVPEETINEINCKTLYYIKHCKKMKSSRNINLTKKYLKQNKLLAVPFDKGIGICIMTIESYREKMDNILKLTQFEKINVTRKNAKNPIIKEEERVCSILKKMKEENKITEKLYDKLRPVGSQPPRLYGLAKVHKENCPMRPVLSMPGSAYAKIGEQVAFWLSKVPECNINSSTQEISTFLKDKTLPQDNELVSFDVSSLYTNVPVREAIHHCADLLFGQLSIEGVSKCAFIELAELASCDVVMSTHDGYYTQVEGLAMGSAPSPHIANGWMSKFDNQIKDESALYFRYMDDIIQNLPSDKITEKLENINNIHQNLKFTCEREVNNSIPFLDMKIFNIQGQLSSKWYRKPTDTGLIMNFHSLAPKRYKTSVVCGMIHRIFRSCSNWQLFHESLEEAKIVLQNNQYPPSFFEPIINKTLSKLVSPQKKQDDKENENEVKPSMVFLNYRGKCSEDYARDLYRICNDPNEILRPSVRVIFTIKRVKSVLPPLKEPVPKMLRSGTVYQITCSRCKTCYVGQTARHLQTRFREHQNNAGPIKSHGLKCSKTFSEDDVTILDSTSKSEQYLLTLEAIHIRSIKPEINTKEEFKSRTLIIKI